MPYDERDRWVDQTISYADKYLSRKRRQWMLMPVVLAMGAAMLGAPTYVMPVVLGVMAVVFLVDKYILSRKTGNNNKPSRSVAPGNFVNSFGRLQAGHDSTSSPQKDTGYSIVRQGRDPQKRVIQKG